MDPLPITQPITPIGDQRPGTGRFARRLAQRRTALHREVDEEEFHDLPPTAWQVDPSQPLLEALDRLRVTNEMRPAELEHAKAMRALKAYQEPGSQSYRAETDPTVVPPA